MNSFMGIEIGKRSVLAHQAALAITGHNVSNANTPGYSRQIPNVVTTSPWHTPMLSGNSKLGQLGTGVEVSDVRRVREQFTDSQIRNETKTSGYWTSLQENLSQIETILNEPSDVGLRSVVDKFWESWQDLSAKADSEAVRAVVAERGKTVAEAFNHTFKQLQELKQDVNDSVAVKVDEINSFAQQITALNKQILSITAAGKQPNDLEDKRDYLLDQLSKIAEVKTYSESNGMISLQLGDRMLVQGINCNQLDTQKDPEGLNAVIWEDTRTLARIDSGELRGLLDVRGKTQLEKEPSTYKEIIPNMIANLNTMAKTIILKTNELHQSGWSLNNKDQTPDRTDFFTVPEGETDSFTNWAEFMKVSKTIADDSKNIAAAIKPTWGTDGEKKNFGDGSNALLIAKLKQSLNSDITEIQLQKTAAVALATDPVNDNVDISFNLTYDSKVLQIIVPTGKYATADARVDAIQQAINDRIGPQAVTVSSENGGLVFSSLDPKYAGIEDLTVEQNGVATDPAVNTIETIKDQLKTGAISFVANDPISMQIKYGADYINITPVTTYTTLDERAQAIQDAINTCLGASLTEPEVTVTAFGESLVFSSQENKLGGVYDLTTGTGAGAVEYEDYQVLKIQDATIDDFWRAICADIGVKSQESERMVKNQETLINELENKRQSESGVSLDEEMTNMIKFQHAYNAASRFITTIDEALDQIINRMGTVGR